MNRKIYQLDLDSGELEPIPVSKYSCESKSFYNALDAYSPKEQDFIQKILTIRKFKNLSELGKLIDTLPYSPISNDYHAMLLYLSTSNVPGLLQNVESADEILNFSACHVRYIPETKKYEWSYDCNIHKGYDGIRDLEIKFEFPNMDVSENIKFSYVLKSSNAINDEMEVKTSEQHFITVSPKGIWYYTYDVKNFSSPFKLTILTEKMGNFLPCKIHCKFTSVMLVPRLTSFLCSLFNDKIKVEKYENYFEMISYDGAEKRSHDLVKVHTT